MTAPEPETRSGSDRPVEPLPETVGRYQILGRLGAGGMGTVYKARDPLLDRIVALKVPRFDGPPEERRRCVQRFQREARAAARIWHPHVCPIYDVGDREDQPYVVMAYVDGPSLAELLAQKRGPDNVGRAVELVRQVLDALTAVHAHGIIHRDLKPGNILIDPNGRAILTDFGLARPEDDGEHLTSAGVLVGTPAYMAPEQAAGETERIGPRTDLYSLAVVLYQLITGKLPFQGPALKVVAQILYESPTPPSRWRPDLDPALERVLLKALARNPDERFASAAEFAEALRRWADALVGQSTTAMPVPEPDLEVLPADDETLPAVLAADVTEARPSPAGPPSAPTRKRRPAPTDQPPAGRRSPWPTAVVVLVLIFLVCGGFSVVEWASSVVNWVQVKLGWQKPGEMNAALLEAAANGEASKVEAALRGGADVNASDKNGETALMKAAAAGHAAVVKALLDRPSRASVHDKDRGGETALMKAAVNGNLGIVKELLSHGARVDEKDLHGETAQAKARARGHADVAEVLARESPWIK
jgi:serine/threonine protein kinase